jgi:hypothetical protein
MDLNKHIVADWATMKIEDAEIDLYGRDSAKFKSMIHEEARRLKDGKAITPEQIDLENFSRICALTKDIRGIEMNGDPIKDPEKLYKLAPGIFEKAQIFILQRANFLPKA